MIQLQQLVRWTILVPRCPYLRDSSETLGKGQDHTTSLTIL